MSKEVAIIGGGLAGIACALTLSKRNIPFKIFDKANQLGGRVNTYERKRLVVDRGFQVFLPRYKTARKLLNLEALDLCYYPSGATVIENNSRKWFGHPLSFDHKYRIGEKIDVTIRDYMQLGIDLLSGFSDPTDRVEDPTRSYFEKYYSKSFRESFLIPFFRGVFLQPDCQKSMNQFRYYLNCFFLGGAAVPRRGMQEIPKQLIAQLPPESIELDTEVNRIKYKELIIGNESHQFEHIIVATDFSSFFDLTDQVPATRSWDSVTNYILAKRATTKCTPLTLVVDSPLVSHMNIPTLISDSMAPKNTHYMNVSTFEEHEPKEIEAEVHRLVGENDWKFVWHDHIEKALPRNQAPPSIKLDHISICGDWTTFSSIEGALSSGIKIGQSIPKF